MVFGHLTLVTLVLTIQRTDHMAAKGIEGQADGDRERRRVWLARDGLELMDRGGHRGVG